MNKSNTISYQTVYSTQIYLNSSNSDIFLNGTMKSNCTYFFKDALKIDKSAIEMRLSVVDAQIPISWYLINSTNNQIKIVNSVGAVTQYTFPNGNYTVLSFITAWYSTVGNSSLWTLSYNTTTNKLSFQSSTMNTYHFSDGDNSIFPLLGFSTGTSYYSNSTGLVTSSYSVNFGGITKLYIKSSTFNLKNMDSKNKGKSRAICAIPINASSNGFIFYNNYSHYKSIFKNYELSSISIEIQDDNKNYIDFNNLDWTMTLQIDIICEVENNIDTLEDIYLNLQQQF